MVHNEDKKDKYKRLKRTAIMEFRRQVTSFVHSFISACRCDKALERQMADSDAVKSRDVAGQVGVIAQWKIQ